MPKSTRTSGVIKYSDIPLSEYTKTANISILIYVVKSGKLSSPIDLSHNHSDIQLGQGATWVGLGWKLIADGSISYNLAGGNEQISGISLPCQYPEDSLNYIGAGEPGVTTEDRLILTTPKSKNI